MPPFVPRFQEAGESEIIDNLMALFHRDMKFALDRYYLDTPTHLTRYGVTNAVGATGEDLPDFVLMTDGEISEFRYPLIVLGLERMSSEETNDGFYLNQDLRVGAGMVVKATSVKAANILARKYVRAAKAVVRTATPGELFPNAGQRVDHLLDIDHRYFEHGKTKDAEYTKPVEIELRFRFGEK